MFTKVDTVDVVFVQFPNKTVEIPSLGTAVLAGVLKKEGYKCVQYDYNVALKDEFLRTDNLLQLREEVLPFLWERNLDNEAICSQITFLRDLIVEISQIFSLNKLDEVKILLQQREYEQIFLDTKSCEVFVKFIKLVSCSNHFFNMITISPEVEKSFPNLFVFKMIDSLFTQIQYKRPYFIGIPIVEMQRQFSIWAIKKFREDYGYGGKIVVGGSDVTYFMDGYLKNFSCLDYAIYQEGEIAIIKLLKYLKGESMSIEEIPNLIYRREQEVIINQPQIINNFEDIVPDFDDLPLDKYITHALPIQASRGCSWGKCTYCKHFRTYGEKYYAGIPQKVVDQVSMLKQRYNTSLFHFVDDDFPSGLKNAIADEILRRNIKIYWLTYSRLENGITKEMLEKWHLAGLYVIEWGLESASESVLRTVKKGINMKHVRRLLLEAHSVGILNKVFMFHNLPSEDYDDLLSSVLFLKEYAQQGVIRVFWEILTPLELLIDTPLYNENMKSGQQGFKKVFKPRGELVAQGGYISKENYTIKKAILVEYISKLSHLGSENHILETNDEAILFDVILEVLYEKHKNLKLKTRITS